MVTPEYRGRGLGHALAERVIEAARRRPARQIVLLTETAARGFRRIARDAADPAGRDSVEFRSACPQSAVCMRADLARRRD